MRLSGLYKLPELLQSNITNYRPPIINATHSSLFPTTSAYVTHFYAQISDSYVGFKLEDSTGLLIWNLFSHLIINTSDYVKCLALINYLYCL